MKTKTVVLCRHAESKENVKIRAFKEGKAKLGEWSLPSMQQVTQSLSLLKYNTDHSLSPAGVEQVKTMARQIQSEGFLESFCPELVCHSPLKRARDTCRGIFGQRESDLELPSLTEMSPAEIFLFKDGVNVRIREFEDWLDSREEERIIAVGHSRYFKVMLNAAEVMDNCSVIKCIFLPAVESGGSSGKERTDDVNPKDSAARLEHGRWQVEEVLYTLRDISKNNEKVKEVECKDIESTSTLQA